jgi:phosphonoacetate hydrolase
VVISQESHCLGGASTDHDVDGLNGARLRTHGGFSERDVPFVISRPMNSDYIAKAKSEQLKNYQIFDYAINGTV